MEETILSYEDVRFLIVQPEHVERFGPNGVKAQAISTLVSSMIEKLDTGSFTVLIDGEKPREHSEDIAYFIRQKTGKEIPTSEIQFVANGDRTYKVVNAADEIAHQLAAIYRKLRTFKGAPYSDLRTPFEITIGNGERKRNKSTFVKKRPRRKL